MADSIHLSVVTADGVLLDTMAGYVNLPTQFGSLGILTGHAAMLCNVSRGKLRYTCNDEQQSFMLTAGGIADVGNNEVTLLISGAEKEH